MIKFYTKYVIEITNEIRAWIAEVRSSGRVKKMR